MTMKCYNCEKAKLQKKKVEYKQFGISLGMFDALLCSNCNETVFEGRVSEHIEKKAKEKGVWGLSRKTKIGTSGTALDIKLPKHIAEFFHLKKGQEVIIEPSGQNKIEITLI
jgi:hypothetical protein